MIFFDFFFFFFGIAFVMQSNWRELCILVHCRDGGRWLFRGDVWSLFKFLTQHTTTDETLTGRALALFLASSISAAVVVKIIWPKKKGESKRHHVYVYQKDSPRGAEKLSLKRNHFAPQTFLWKWRHKTQVGFTKSSCSKFKVALLDLWRLNRYVFCHHNIAKVWGYTTQHP